MVKFIVGFIIGVFLIPTIKTIFFDLWWSSHKLNILREPIQFIKDVFYTTFQ